MWNKVIKEIETKMDKTLNSVSQDLSTLRTGRATPAIFDALRVQYYGTSTPLKQVANISAPEPRLMVIQPWDASCVKDIEKAILTSDMGLQPQVEGKIIRISIPPLSKERREDMVKIVKKMSEDGRVALRAVRRDGNEQTKQLEKDKKITEDDREKALAKIQDLTNRYSSRIDEVASVKEKELVTV